MQKTFLPADILLPKKDMEKWAVIACDQYTSNKEYWENIENETAGAASALNIILPEIYLEDDADEKITKINSTMDDYLKNGVFCEYKNCYIYLERTLKNGMVRHGIVGMLDLEDYDYRKGATSLVRATEATVLERIPPRVKIRKNASLEIPHVMLLSDDREDSVISLVKSFKEQLEKVYDFDLVADSGHATGYLITGAYADKVNEAFEKLTDGDEDKLLFAVGDGNHSLATAKECYEQDKNELNRYALCEVVNIGDESLQFEPIYRVLFDVNPEEFIARFVADLGGEYYGEGAHKYTCVFGDTKREISVKATSKLAVGTLQSYLDKFAADVKIDYIHGEDEVISICKAQNTLGFIFDSMGKDELFDAVKLDGSLPRKTFSMGHADDKRFYIEARKIK